MSRPIGPIRKDALAHTGQRRVVEGAGPEEPRITISAWVPGGVTASWLGPLDRGLTPAAATGRLGCERWPGQA